MSSVEWSISLMRKEDVLQLDKSLARKLKQLRVPIDLQDGDTIRFRNVPTSETYFNKSHTNLLIKRPREGMPFLICVDEDLAYNGREIAIMRAFSGGHRQNGWRVLLIHRKADGVQSAVGDALAILGFDGREPALTTPAQGPHATSAMECPPEPMGRLLTAFGEDLSTPATEAELTIGREERVEEVISCLLQWRRRLALIVGESGVGKTNLIHAVARRLGKCLPKARVFLVDAGVMLAGTSFESERENLLAELFNDVKNLPDGVLALDHIEQALIGAPRALFLLRHALDRGTRVVGTTLPAFLSFFDVAPLRRLVQPVQLSEASLDETFEVLFAAMERISDHYRICVDESMIPVVIDAAALLSGRLPEKALTLLDAAVASAALRGEIEVSFYDIDRVTDRIPHSED